MDVCRHCKYHPAYPERRGYCSWDCHDHDYRPPEDGERREVCDARSRTQ